MFQWRKVCIFLISIDLILEPSDGHQTQAGIQVEGNGYRGVSVGISENVPENSQLIDSIKSAFTKGSRLLYKATGYRLYFKQIDIYVPKSWSTNSAYTKVTGTRFESFPIRIDLPSPLSSAPFVRGLTSCGGLGQYMHLTPSLLANPESGYGSHDHIIVHEWGHLRFGVFDEYPTILRKGILQRFYNEGGTWKPVRCTEEIQGFISTDCSDRSKTCRRSSDGQPEKACRFCINSGATTAKASLMGNQWLPTLQEFCDVDDPNSTPTNRHTSSSVNKQTTYCDGKSIWEILRTHSDIKGNTPGSQNQNTDPTFRLFQEKDDLIVVLVLDVSGSMSGVPLQKLRQAATRYIMNTASNGTWLGIVKFNALATVSRVLTQITSVSVRESLTNSLPSSAAGSTSIGAGLEKGYEMIEAHRTNIIGSTLLLVTDGNENSSPYIADVKPDIVSKGIKVNTLAYGVNADPALEALAFATGGNSFFYTGSDNATGLDDAFDTLVTSKEQSLQVQFKDIFRDLMFSIQKKINGMTLCKEIKRISNSVATSTAKKKNNIRNI